MGARLHPGEEVLWRGHPSWRSIIWLYVKGLALTTAAALMVAVVTTLIGDGTDEVLVGAVALAGVALTLLAGFAKRIATAYTVTDHRLHIRRGIISRSVQETRLDRVQNVNYRQSLIQRVLRVGDVDFDTASGHEYEFTFAGVADPPSIVHTVNAATHSPDAGPSGSL